jgi:3-oxoacyl-(acyl-carrier-protein) synthase
LWQPTNDGIVPGEGAACWIVESEASARARGRSPLARLTAVALASGEKAQADALSQLGALEGPALICAASPDSHPVDEMEAATARALPFAARSSAVAPKLLTGDLFSVSPLLAGILAVQTAPGGPGLQALAAPPSAQPFQTAVLLCRDPNGTAGAVRLDLHCGG